MHLQPLKEISIPVREEIGDSVGSKLKPRNTPKRPERKSEHGETKPAQSRVLRISDVFDDVFAGAPFSGPPRWPPDLFCFAASVLQKSGAYTRVTCGLNLWQDFSSPSDRAEKLRALGEKWQTSKLVPKLVFAWWDVVKSARHLPLRQTLSEDGDGVTAALINLLAIADEASRGFGITEQDAQDRFSFEAEFTLAASGYLTLCRTVNASRYAVLPKMRTAQSGLTIRSFSHNLALIHSREIDANWFMPYTSKTILGRGSVLRPKLHAFNLLLIPWPKELQPSQFIASGPVQPTDVVPRGSYGMFKVLPGVPPSAGTVKRLLEVAETRVGDINGVIFPELALSENSFQKISRQVATTNRFCMSGIGSKSADPANPGANYLRFDFGIPGEEFVASLRQWKHHRWKLNKAQILQYGVGANLNPEANWWEHICLDQRKLSFINLRDWLTVMPLICEDLARPEPVGDLVRAVGPNLVIAILMDGPQLGSRWPGRYATSLADDPGCSVLTVTSGGMSRLCKTRTERDRSDVVALWRDPQTGTHEIELPKDGDAIVLNITVEYQEEWTADGRGDKEASGCPILAGHHQISLHNER